MASGALVRNRPGGQPRRDRARARGLSGRRCGPRRLYQYLPKRAARRMGSDFCGRDGRGRADRCLPPGLGEAEELVDRYAETGRRRRHRPSDVDLRPRRREFTAHCSRWASSWTMPAYLPGGLSIVGVSDVVDGILAAYGLEPAASTTSSAARTSPTTGRSPESPTRPAAPARIRVPARRSAAGPVAEVVDAVADRRMFPSTGRWRNSPPSDCFTARGKPARAGLRVSAARGARARCDGVVRGGSAVVVGTSPRPIATEPVGRGFSA